jgi:hypothetical protein
LVFTHGFHPHLFSVLKILCCDFRFGSEQFLGRYRLGHRRLLSTSTCFESVQELKSPLRLFVSG